MLRALLLSSLVFLAACSPSEDPPSVVPETEFSEAAVFPEGHKSDQWRTITIAADPWCPHNCEAGSEREGYMVEIAREAFAPARLKVRYVNMSWARALAQAKEGYVDAVVGAFVSDAPSFVFPDEAIGHARTVLFAHADSDWSYQNIDSLKQLKLIAINGYSYSPELDGYIETNKGNPERVWIISGPSPLDRAIELLGQERTDVLPEDLQVMQWTLAHMENPPALRQVVQLQEMRAYIAFSPANPESPDLAALLSEGVRNLRQSGRLQEILARYGLSWSD
ncbi:transporter substrate-binding domain-containing protein [Marinobacter sp. M216]|uniref:Transporter substrate-binding domain-containing protein n=1 Tax=Marinobacter albus TaxID=3030833 RepID=A0ABT7H8J9_9GAMM|nr:MULTISPECIES: transporter substrate-binding domain-containing protein [unclassified Marinobacter]MBW7471345.1 transporter substrate-binding domain-containing protein [Marinobacter sp. F4218]MDK9556377.1 transporter substrate-binding domain-containing protein [Marinobacter sp. M216]